MPSRRVRPLSLVVIVAIAANKRHLIVELPDLVEASSVRDIVHEEHGVVFTFGENVLPHLGGL